VCLASSKKKKKKYVCACMHACEPKKDKIRISKDGMRVNQKKIRLEYQKMADNHKRKRKLI
jgi:hypothetical protein